MIDNFHQLNVKYDCTQFNTIDLVRIHFERNFELSHVDCNMTKGLIGNTIMMKLKSILEKKNVICMMWLSNSLQNYGMVS